MRVMIVEDQTMIRSLLESYFRAEDGYRIVASIPGAKQAVEVCRTSSVDLILMDVQTENRENGLTAVRQIKAIQPKSKIIVVTSLIDCAVLDEAKRAGADSLWYKDSTQKRLMDVVRQTMAGEHIFPDAPPTVEIGMAKSTEFTKTELKVLRHLMRGLSYTRIAAEMGCEMSTVKFHVANMLQKTGLENKLHKFPSELSGGEQQRVSVARALAKRPEVLFLDEPTGALDEDTGRQVLQYISELQKEYGFTIIMVTHNLNIAEMAKTVIRMNNGKVSEVYTTQTQKTAYEIGW